MSEHRVKPGEPIVMNARIRIAELMESLAAERTRADEMHHDIDVAQAHAARYQTRAYAAESRERALRVALDGERERIAQFFETSARTMYTAGRDTEGHSQNHSARWVRLIPAPALADGGGGG